MKPARPIVNGSDTAFTGNLKRWGADVVDALGSKSDHPGMRVPFPFEVRRGWKAGDSLSRWGVHGGAIQVGSTVYKCDVTETLGDGRRWQPIDDPDELLLDSPLACTVYAAVAGGFVVFSTDPDMAGAYVTPIAKLDGVRIVQLVVGNIRMPGIGEGGGAIRLEAYDTETSPMQFSSLYQTNTAVLSAADIGGGVYTTITTGVNGIYSVKLEVEGEVDINVTAGIASVGIDSGGDSVLAWSLDARDVAKTSGGSVNRIKLKSSVSADMYLNAGETLTCIPSVLNGYINSVVWTINLYQAYEAPAS
jgi:hypothetical protein